MKLPIRGFLLIIAILMWTGYLTASLSHFNSSPFVNILKSMVEAKAVLASSSPQSVNTITPTNGQNTISLTTLSGKKVTLNDLMGKPIILVTWATWCSECDKELQALQMAKEDQQLPVRLVLINLTSEEASVSEVKNYLEKHHITLPVLLDQKGHFLKTFHIQVVPTSLLMDKDAHILHTFYGPLDLKKVKEWLPTSTAHSK